MKQRFSASLLLSRTVHEKRVHEKRALFLLLIWLVLSCIYWWPGGLEFRSDDYLAIVYTQDPKNVLADFVGPQYGLPRLALFHRPLITLSIAMDAFVGGGGPFIPHLMNLLVHLGNGMLLFFLLRRFVPFSAAASAMFFWSFHPGHTEAVSWMVGRVDVYATFFYLLAIVHDLRYREGKSKRLWPALLLFFLGCLCKELCLTLPGTLLLLWLVRSPGGIRARSLRAVHALLPYCALLFLVLLMRYFVLGECIGGYAAAELDLLPALEFWTAWVPDAGTWYSLGPALAALVLLLLHLKNKLPKLLPCALVFMIMALPSFGARGEQTKRYLYLPMAAMAAAASLGGPFCPLLLFLACVKPAMEERAELRSLGEQVRRIRKDAARRIGSSPSGAGPVFVWAPRNIGSKVCFNVGTDRLGVAPFGPGGRTVFPERAVDTVDDGRESEQERKPPIGDKQPVYRGPDILDAVGLYRIKQGEVEAEFYLDGLRAHSYLLLVATSQGWFRVSVPCDTNGRAKLKDALLATLVDNASKDPLIEHLWPSIEFSLKPEVWCYLEAMDENGRSIGASSRGFRLRFKRDFGLGLHPKKPGLLLLLCFAVLTVLLAVFRLGRSREEWGKPAE